MSYYVQLDDGVLVEDSYITSLPRVLTYIDLECNNNLRDSCMPQLPRGLRHLVHLLLLVLRLFQYIMLTIFNLENVRKSNILCTIIMTTPVISLPMIKDITSETRKLNLALTHPLLHTSTSNADINHFTLDTNTSNNKHCHMYWIEPHF